MRRGLVYRAKITDSSGDLVLKPFVVVSNNTRNEALGSALAVRLTTSTKPSIPSIVELASSDAPLFGRVVCDDIYELYDDEEPEHIGALSVLTMQRVGAGLRVVFGL